MIANTNRLYMLQLCNHELYMLIKEISHIFLSLEAVTCHIHSTIFLSLAAVSVSYMLDTFNSFSNPEAVFWFCSRHLGVWGELASHQRSLTHRPSSQGWASRCLSLSGFYFGLMGCIWVAGLSFCLYLLIIASVLYTCISLHVLCTKVLYHRYPHVRIPSLVSSM